MRKTRLFCLASLAALTAACTTVGPNYKAPTPPASQSYAMAGDVPTSEAQIGQRLAGDWWALFQSPEIDQTVRAAVAGNHSLEAARQSLLGARDAIATQDARATLDANASVQETRVNLSSFGFSQFPLPGGETLTLSNPTFTDYAFGLTGKYDFDLFGQRTREHERLLADADAQAWQTDAAYLTLTAQVVGQAIAIAGLKAQIAAEEQIVQSDQANLDLVSKAFELGGGTRLDVATVRTELSGDQAQITPLRQQLAAARHALALLVGQAPDGFAPPDFDLDRITQPTAVPVELPSELVRDRPDIQASEAELHAAVAQIGVSTGDLYPKITLNGNITQSALEPQNLFGYGATGFAIGPGVSYSLLGRSQLHAKVRMAEDTARQAYANYQQVVLKAFVQVSDALQAIAHDDELLAQAQDELSSSADALRLQRLRYQDGKAALLPVLDNQRSYARASMAVVHAKAQRLQDTAALVYAVSRNWNRSATTEPQRTDIAAVAQPNPQKWPLSVFEGSGKGR
ncbi:MAG TPA: efflux transporter outer membrane subunit [Caulobacteraceae bacterium]|nr:efflux transporter outer membrane subunit [Caulobacteraceae bacterium]